MEKNLEKLIGENETILWKGVPNKKCFILESIFNPLLPFALIWALIDIFALSSMFAGLAEEGGMFLFIIMFFTLHLMPVWIYIFGVIFSVLKFKRTQFLVTDKGVYISGGLFSFSFEMKPFTQLSNITLHQGIFDRMLKVGDVVFSTNDMPVVTGRNRQINNPRFAIINIPDYEKVYKLVKQLQTDVFSDTMYPNDLRPGTNRGYQTTYSRKDDFFKKDDEFFNNK